LSHRIGILQKGADADVVLWDRHPLRLGAIPRQVWIDGKLEIGGGGLGGVDVGPHAGAEAHIPPRTPNYDEERRATVEWEGLPPLEGRRVHKMVLNTVREIWTRKDGAVVQQFVAPHAKATADAYATIVDRDGRIDCVSSGPDACAAALAEDGDEFESLDLRGGVLMPALMTYGSPLGLEEIASEPSTGDGPILDAFKDDIPDILGDKSALVRAVDGLVFGTRNAL
jgi:hypothetical protein